MAIEKRTARLQRVDGLQVPTLSVHIPGEGETTLAQTVAQWTEVGGMLPKKPGEIIELFRRKHSVVMLNGDTPVSHAAVTFEYETSGDLEVGAVVTSPSFLRRGAAREGTYALLDMLGRRYPERRKFAMANGLSKPMFDKMGGRVMDMRELDPDVLTFCETCPSKKLPAKGDIFRCCDTPIDLTHVRR